MKAEQLYYTSCENGLENASGFQIKAMSNGFTKTNDVRQLGAYEPARDLPSQPNLEELKEFPILFKYKDNVFVRSVYVGRDYTQRFGNYFMHTLEVDEITFYPIDLYFWNGWVSNEENIDILTLRSIEIEKVNPEPFILENKELLSELIATLFLRDKQIIIKTSTQMEGIKLLNFMQKAFPLHIAKNITFSTYQFSYTDCLDINLVVGDTEWEHIDKSGFYFFDLTKDLYPKINIDNKYSISIVEFLDNPKELEKFFNFFKYFNLNELNNNLNFILELFLFIEFNKRIDNLEEVLFCISTYIKKEYNEEFLEYLKPLINNIKTINELETILSFYIGIFSNTVVNDINKILIILLNNSLESKYSFLKFQNFMNRINEKYSNFEIDFAKYFLKQISKNKISINENEFYVLIEKLKIYTKLVRDTTLSYEDFEKIIVRHIQDNKIIDFKTIKLFEVAQQRELLIRTSNILSDNELKKMAEFFISYYEGENYFITVKSLINTDAKTDFMILLYQYKLNSIKNRKEFLKQYIAKVGNYPEIYYYSLEQEEKINFIEKYSGRIEEYEDYHFFNDIWQQINESLFDSFINSHELHSLYLEKYNHIKLKQFNNFLLRRAIVDYKLINKQLLAEIQSLSKEGYKEFLKFLFGKLESKKFKSTNFQYVFHPIHKEVFIHYFFKEKNSIILEFYLNGLGNIEKEIETPLITKLSKLNKRELSLLVNETSSSKKSNKLLEKIEEKRNKKTILNSFFSFIKKDK